MSAVCLKKFHPAFFPYGSTYTKKSTLLWLVNLSVFISILGCGGGGTTGGGGQQNPTGTTVTVNLPGPPAAMAVQTGTGPFAAIPAASFQNGQVSFTVPGGSSKYAFAYLCTSPGGGEAAATANEFIIEATTADTTSLTTDCNPIVRFQSASGPTLAAATGNVDASIFPAFLDVSITGKQGFNIGAFLTGPFSASLPTGANDIAFVVLNNGGNQAILGQPLGIKIFRNQTVPGAVNGGSTIVFGSGDFPGQQPMQINAPAGFFVDPQATEVVYTTANGTVFPIESGSGPGLYPTIPGALVQSGDFYSFGSSAITSARDASVGTFQKVAGGGGFVTLNLPDPWLSPNPTTTGSHTTFTFDYPGFPDIPIKLQRVFINWANSRISANSITVIATASFQSGTNTISIPDLSSLGQGFFACCPSGLGIGWLASILASTTPVTIVPQDFISTSLSGPFLPPGASAAFVQNSGSFTAP